MDLKSTYNLIARDWSADHEHDNWWVAGTNKFVRLLPKNGKVLDVGCGSGWKSRYLQDRGLAVTGFDFSEKMIALARKHSPKSHFFVAELKATEGVGDGYDGIFAQAVLLHVPKTEAAQTIATLDQKLKPGGYFYIAVKKANPGQNPEQVVRENDYGYEYERFFSFWEPQEIEALLKVASYSIVYRVVETWGEATWIQIIGKKLAGLK